MQYVLAAKVHLAKFGFYSGLINGRFIPRGIHPQRHIERQSRTIHSSADLRAGFILAPEFKHDCYQLKEVTPDQVSVLPPTPDKLEPTGHVPTTHSTLRLFLIFAGDEQSVAY